MTFKRLTTATVLTGVLITGGVGAAFSGTAHAATAPGARVSHAAAVRHTARVRRNRRVHRTAQHALRVTAVNGDTINAITRGNLPVTITVGTTTTYKEVGVTTASLSNVQPGESILARGKRTATRTIQATMVRILLARDAGVVTAVNGSSLTVTGASGTPHMVNIAATAAITQAGVTAQASDITPNTVIVAAGTPNADGSLNAIRVVIRAAHIAGRVTAVNGSAITVQGAYGATYTVNTSSSTVYATRHSRTLAAATASTVTAGRRIVAYGALSTDGKTLTATRIVVGRVVAKRVR
jgi:hypothetical protein